MGDNSNSNGQSHYLVPPSQYHKGASYIYPSLVPKQQLNLYNNSRKNQPNSSGLNYSRNNNGKNARIYRTQSLESSTNYDIKVVPIASIPDNSDVDSEEDTQNQVMINSDKINSTVRTKRSNQRYASRSLPVTPRVNGNSPLVSGSNAINGIMASPFLSSSATTSTPLLMAPHLAPNHSLDGSFNSIMSLSPSNSQYVTCTSGLMSEAHDKVLPGSIDYSSLPLPRDDSFKNLSRRDISRHMSEPCIHEVINSNLCTLGKCQSCLQKKCFLKGRKKDTDMFANNVRTNSFRNSFGGIDSKMDDVEGVEMQWQFIRTLVDELNKIRSQNNRMAVELHQAKLEIHLLKNKLDTYGDVSMQPGIVTDLVGQIHAAQKLRDEAMMSRIKLANEERDAALAQTRILLEKFGVSPRTPLDHGFFGKSDYAIFNSPINRAEESINILSLEEELKALKLAINLQDELQDKNKDINFLKEGHNHELFDEFKTKLNDSESSRSQLQDRCAKLERIFSGLRRKLNGLNSGESLHLSTIPNLKMPYFEQTYQISSLNSQCASQTGKRSSSSSTSSGKTFENKLKQGKSSIPSCHDSCHNALGVNCLENELKDSSLESVETTSSSSWKQMKERHSCQLSTCESNSSLSHSTLTPPSPHSPRLKSNNRNMEGNCPWKDEAIHDSLQIINGEAKNIDIVSLMGPITEL